MESTTAFPSQKESSIWASTVEFLADPNVDQMTEKALPLFLPPGHRKGL